MSWPIFRDASGRYAVAVDHVPDEAVALERDLAAAQALAARLNEAFCPVMAGSAATRTPASSA